MNYHNFRNYINIKQNNFIITALLLCIIMLTCPPTILSATKQKATAFLLRYIRAH
jgi:hypothetical protein